MDRCDCHHPVSEHAWDDDARWPCTRLGCSCVELAISDDED